MGRNSTGHKILRGLQGSKLFRKPKSKQVDEYLENAQQTIDEFDPESWQEESWTARSIENTRRHVQLINREIER